MNISTDQMAEMTEAHDLQVAHEHHPKKQILYFRRALQVFFKYKKLILGFFFGTLILVSLVTFLIPPEYRASSTIIIERHVDTEKSVLLGIESENLRDLKDWLIGEIEILKSTPVIGRVVQTLNLEDNADQNAMTAGESRLKAIEKVKQALVIENPRKSNVINLQIENNNPRIAAAILNGIVKNYQIYRNEVYSESASYQYFIKQIERAEKQLLQKESELAAFKKEHGIVSPDAQVEIILRKLSAYETSLTRTRTERIGKQAKAEIIRKSIQADTLINIPVLENTETPNRYTYWARMRLEMLHLEMQRDSLLFNYTPEFKGVKTLNAQINTTRKKMGHEVQQILNEENGRVEALKKEEVALEGEIAIIKNELKNFSDKEVKFTKLNREIDNQREIYSLLLKQRDDASLSLDSGLHGIAVRVVSEATVPVEPGKPMKKLNLLLGFFLAIFVSLSVALIREFFDNTIDTPEKAERYTGLPVLTTVTDCSITSN